MDNFNIGRKRAVALGSFWGIINQIATMLIAFITRNLFLKYLSIDMLGYNTLFTELVGFLNFAELGLGASISFALYKPLADRDYDRVCTTYNLLCRIYRIIGAVVLVLGLIMLCCLPYLVQGGIENIGYMRLVFLLFLVNTVAGYLFLPQRNFLSVAQRGYILEIVVMTGTILSSVLKLAALITTQSYLLYLVMQFGTMLVCYLFYPWYVRRNFPYLRRSRGLKSDRETERKLLKNSWSMVYFCLSATVIGFTDNIIISSFLGVTIIGYFANYKMIVDIIRTFIQKILSPVGAALSSFASEKASGEVILMLERISFAIYFIGSFCCVSLTVLSSGFITLWLGTQYVMDILPAYVFIVNMYIVLAIAPINSIFNVSGCYIKNKRIAVIEILVNLIVSISLIQIIGLTGVFVGTTCCYLTSFAFKTVKIYAQVFERPVKSFMAKSILYLCLSAAMPFVCYYVINVLPPLPAGLTTFLIKCAACVIIPNAVNIILFARSREFQYYFGLIKRFAPGR